MIRKTKLEDIDQILKILSIYNFKILNPKDNKKIDSNFDTTITLRNKIVELDIEHSFVAIHEDKIVGFCHYKIMDKNTAKTTLITVIPEFRKCGYGTELQLARMKEAYKNGCNKLITWCETPKVIDWYINRFKYVEVAKEEQFHTLHFIRNGKDIIWGVHYGFQLDGLTKLECDLHEFFKDQAFS